MGDIKSHHNGRLLYSTMVLYIIASLYDVGFKKSHMRNQCICSDKPSINLSLGYIRCSCGGIMQVSVAIQSIYDG